jgi:hypothetical protein
LVSGPGVIFAILVVLVVLVVPLPPDSLVRILISGYGAYHGREYPTVKKKAQKGHSKVSRPRPRREVNISPQCVRPLGG